MKLLSFWSVFSLLISINVFADFCHDFDRNAFVEKQAIHFSQFSCKVMPNSPEKAVLAFLTAEASVPSYEGNLPYKYVIDLYVLDIPSNKIIGRNNEVLIPELTYDVEDFEVDVGKYYINKMQRAFGVRVKSKLHSSTVLISEEWLNLYVESNGKLQNILNNQRVGTENGICSRSCDCKNEKENITLSILSESNVNFADIELISTYTISVTNQTDDDQCIEKPDEITKTKRVLKYSSGHYH